MKNTILLSLIILSFFACKQKSNYALEYENLYSNNIRARHTALYKLGEWDYSTNKKDSTWNQTHTTHNLNLIETVFTELKLIELEWDSLVFLSKKHDTIPLPSEENMKLLERHQEAKLLTLKWKSTLEKSIERGLYTRDGKELKQNVLQQSTVVQNE